jgi:hypothetical protein
MDHIGGTAVGKQRFRRERAIKRDRRKQRRGNDGDGLRVFGDSNDARMTEHG